MFADNVSLYAYANTLLLCYKYPFKKIVLGPQYTSSHKVMCHNKFLSDSKRDFKATNPVVDKTFHAKPQI